MFASRLKPTFKQLYVVWPYSWMKWMQLKELRGSWIVTFYIAFILHRTGVNVWLSTWLLRKLQSTLCEQLSICAICSSSIRTLIMSMISELVENCFQQASSFIFCLYFIENGITVAPIFAVVSFSCWFYYFHLILASFVWTMNSQSISLDVLDHEMFSRELLISFCFA